MLVYRSVILVATLRCIFLVHFVLELAYFSASHIFAGFQTTHLGLRLRFTCLVAFASNISDLIFLLFF